MNDDTEVATDEMNNSETVDFSEDKLLYCSTRRPTN